MKKLVTCPESAHLEEIECEATPCGIVIVSCSRLGEGEMCARECARRLDQRAARDRDRAMARGSMPEVIAMVVDPFEVDDFEDPEPPPFIPRNPVAELAPEPDFEDEFGPLDWLE